MPKERLTERQHQQMLARRGEMDQPPPLLSDDQLRDVKNMLYERVSGFAGAEAMFCTMMKHSAAVTAANALRKRSPELDLVALFEGLPAAALRRALPTASLQREFESARQKYKQRVDAVLEAPADRYTRELRRAGGWSSEQVNDASDAAAMPRASPNILSILLSLWRQQEARRRPRVQKALEKARFEKVDIEAAVSTGNYEVQAILDKKGSGQYFLQWKGFGPSWCSWEPSSNIDRDVLAEFKLVEKQHKPDPNSTSSNSPSSSTSSSSSIQFVHSRPQRIPRNELFPPTVNITLADADNNHSNSDGCDDGGDCDDVDEDGQGDEDDTYIDSAPDASLPSAKRQRRPIRTFIPTPQQSTQSLDSPSTTSHQPSLAQPRSYRSTPAKTTTTTPTSTRPKPPTTTIQSFPPPVTISNQSRQNKRRRSAVLTPMQQAITKELLQAPGRALTPEQLCLRVLASTTNPRFLDPSYDIGRGVMSCLSRSDIRHFRRVQGKPNCWTFDVSHPIARAAAPPVGSSAVASRQLRSTADALPLTLDGNPRSTTITLPMTRRLPTAPPFKVFGISLHRGRLFHAVGWTDPPTIYLVDSVTSTKLYPLLVRDFYESKIAAESVKE